MRYEYRNQAHDRLHGAIVRIVNPVPLNPAGNVPVIRIECIHPPALEGIKIYASRDMLKELGR